jgi:hypothetical protein
MGAGLRAQWIERRPTVSMDSFEIDRRENALNLINMDKHWCQGQFGRRDKINSKTLPSPDEVRKYIGAFISGVETEYAAGYLCG